MKGKDLKVGQHVVLIKIPGKKQRRYQRITVLTVNAIAYPFVVFYYETVQPSVLMTGSGPTIQTNTSRETFVVNVRGCKFREVTEEFALLARREGGSESGERLPTWLTESDN